MLMKKLISTLLITLFSLFNTIAASAQEDMTLTESITEDKHFTILVDGTAILLNGFGGKAVYSINDTVAVGGIASYQKLKSTDNEIYKYDYTHTIGMVGVVAELYIAGVTQKNSAYLTLGANYATVNSEVNDSLFGTSNVADSSRGGLITAFGWQYRERITDTANIIIQVGLGYGNGGAIKWRFSGTETQIENGAHLDIKAGSQF